MFFKFIFNTYFFFFFFFFLKKIDINEFNQINSIFSEDENIKFLKLLNMF